MEKTFDKLQQEYLDAEQSKDESHKTKILEEMRLNLKQRNDGNDCFETTIEISSATIDQLKIIDGLLRIKESSDILTKKSDAERERQTSKNKYNKENPYPGNR